MNQLKIALLLISFSENFEAKKLPFLQAADVTFLEDKRSNQLETFIILKNAFY